MRGVQVGKEYASKAKAAKTPAQASVCAEEGIEAVNHVLIVQGKGVLWELQRLARQMRQVPQIDLCVPTVSPNTVASVPMMLLHAPLAFFTDQL